MSIPSHIPATKPFHLSRPSVSLEPAVLLLWAASRSPLLTRLCSNVSREICTFVVSPVLLPAIYGKQLYVVNVLSLEYRFIAFPSKYDAIFYPINSVAALCIQRIRGGNQVYWFDLISLQLTKLLIRPLAGNPPVACCVCGTIYTFRYGNPSGKFNICRWKWYSLPNVSIQLYISFLFPHGNTIFLCVAMQMLRFNILSEHLFQPIDTTSCFNELFYGQIRLRSNDNKLLFLTFDFNMWVWDWESNVFIYKQRKRSYEDGPYKQGYALKIEQEVYWMDWGSPVVNCYHTERQERGQKGLRFEAY